MKSTQPLILPLLSMALFTAFLGYDKAHAESITGSAELSTGVAHDSNVNIPELNQNSRNSDTAVAVGAKFDGKWKATQRLTLNAGYRFSSKVYRRTPEYDLSLHQLSAEATYELALANVGISRHYANASLNKRKFLTLQQTSIFAGKLIREKIYLRVAATTQDKQFASLAERNATNRSMSGDAFVFFNDGKTFVNVGVAHENENAMAKVFDYTGNTIKTSFSHQYHLWNIPQKLQLATRYSVRNYLGINPEIRQARRDAEHVSEVAWEVSLTPTIAATTKVEYGNYHSNISSAAFSAAKTSLNLSAQF